jgi:predicted RNase H-like nuclease (RuvC/YqgF family)
MISGKDWDKYIICEGCNKRPTLCKILFGKTIKEVFDDIYSEINPVLKYKKMKKYHQELKEEVEKSEKELEEKKKAVEELENKLKQRKNGNK